MKNKRGILLASETLKIVLSVIAIAILAYLLFALYHANASSEKLEHAKATMEKISQTINQLKLNSSYPGNISQITPIGWSIFSFVQNEVKPNPCSGQDCLCICESVYAFWGIKNRQENECGKKGVCLIVKDLQKSQEISIDRNGGAFTSIEIKKAGKWIEVIEK